MAKEKIPLSLYHIGNKSADKYIKKNLEQVIGYCLVYGETDNISKLAENKFISLFFVLFIHFKVINT
ncbi:MAG: hypothetical protein K2K02_01070 [Ruminococcus sp.]|nr:hypothetical protein [Ruminococcus sp.]